MQNGTPFPHDDLLLGPLICWSGCTVVQATGNRFNQSNTGRNANAAADDAAADASEQLRTFFEDLQACIIAPLYLIHDTGTYNDQLQQHAATLLLVFGASSTCSR